METNLNLLEAEILAQFRVILASKNTQNLNAFLENINPQQATTREMVRIAKRSGFTDAAIIIAQRFLDLDNLYNKTLVIDLFWSQYHLLVAKGDEVAFNTEEFKTKSNDRIVATAYYSLALDMLKHLELVENEHQMQKIKSLRKRLIASRDQTDIVSDPSILMRLTRFVEVLAENTSNEIQDFIERRDAIEGYQPWVRYFQNALNNKNFEEAKYWRAELVNEGFEVPIEMESDFLRISIEEYARTFQFDQLKDTVNLLKELKLGDEDGITFRTLEKTFQELANNSDDFNNALEIIEIMKIYNENNVDLKSLRSQLIKNQCHILIRPENDMYTVMRGYKAAKLLIEYDIPSMASYMNSAEKIIMTKIPDHIIANSKGNLSEKFKELAKIFADIAENASRIYTIRTVYLPQIEEKLEEVNFSFYFQQLKNAINLEMAQRDYRITF